MNPAQIANFIAGGLLMIILLWLVLARGKEKNEEVKQGEIRD